MIKVSSKLSIKRILSIILLVLLINFILIVVWFSFQLDLLEKLSKITDKEEQLKLIYPYVNQIGIFSLISYIISPMIISFFTKKRDSKSAIWGIGFYGLVNVIAFPLFIFYVPIILFLGWLGDWLGYNIWPKNSKDI